MLDIRPATDLQNRFSEIENSVQRGNPVYLTENGYGTMVILSLEQYSALVSQAKLERYGETKLTEGDFAKMTAEEGFGGISLHDETEEEILDECDRRAAECTKRYSHEEMYAKLRGSLNAE